MQTVGSRRAGDATHVYARDGPEGKGNSRKSPEEMERGSVHRFKHDEMFD